MKTIELDGNSFGNLDTFYDEVERKPCRGKVANVLIVPHDEGACNQLSNFLRLLPTACYFDRR
jgi:hypothetical protein